MLIFLYGADTFRLRRKARQIISEYETRSGGADFAVFDMDESRPADLSAAFWQTSLFGAKRFFVVKNPISRKETKEALIVASEGIAAMPHNFLFLQEGKVLKTDRFLKAICKLGQVQEFAPLEGTNLEKWIIAEFAALGHSEGGTLAPALAAAIGGDLWRMSGEIGKLVHFAGGKAISAADAAKIVSPVAENNIFQTVDAIAAGKKKEALRMVRRHTAAGDHPLYLLAMIAAQFRNLILVKRCPAAGARGLGMHPYVFSKSAALARRFDGARLEKSYGLIWQADFDIKTGKVDAAAGLDFLIAKL
ncbi:MAG TPA: DNA polymerase III subunit delta [Candidatus Pacearchaeota archaeon]|jgi:DNA polymerase-3 subunit delta|nr:DNA polymerase III subunit delta [Candidatus Pacearchaeota archaeon]